MANTDFEKYGVKVLADDTADGAANAQGGVNISEMKKGFVLSRIDVSGNEPANEADFSEAEIAKIKKDLGAEEIPDDEKEKYGMVDDPFHLDHMKQAA
jgi:hypothetical protein